MFLHSQCSFNGIGAWHPLSCPAVSPPKIDPEYRVWVTLVVGFRVRVVLVVWAASVARFDVYLRVVSKKTRAQPVRPSSAVYNCIALFTRFREYLILIFPGPFVAPCPLAPAVLVPWQTRPPAAAAVDKQQRSRVPQAEPVPLLQNNLPGVPPCPHGERVFIAHGSWNYEIFWTTLSL